MIVKESPLKGMSVGTVDMVSIRELPGLHTIDLRVAPGTPSFIAVVEAMGIEFPLKIGQFFHDNGVHVLCLAPDWWIIVGLEDFHQKLELLRLNEEHHFSVVDVSGQRTSVELEGPNAREVLAHLWEQDLREKSFPVGSVSQGLMVKAPVIVYHVGPFRYRVMVRSSFALHFWEALTDAAVEWV
jgi:heterotetrameric sarcosine oxidase gamma subunit